MLDHDVDRPFLRVEARALHVSNRQPRRINPATTGASAKIQHEAPATDSVAPYVHRHENGLNEDDGERLQSGCADPCRGG